MHLKLTIMETIKHIWFHNNTDVPIMIDSWVDGSSKLQCLRVSPLEKIIIHSSVGEWHLNSMFRNRIDFALWNQSGLENYISLGKFRSQPCSRGDYVWLNYDNLFDCKYTELEEADENVKGIITFSIINQSSFILK